MSTLGNLVTSYSRAEDLRYVKRETFTRSKEQIKSLNGTDSVQSVDIALDVIQPLIDAGIITISGGGGTTVQQYTNGQAEIWASGTGVTLSVNSGTQEFTFNIPTGVKLYAASVNFTLTDVGGGGVNKAYLIFDYAGARSFNTSINKIVKPVVSSINTDNIGCIGRGANGLQIRYEGQDTQSLGSAVTAIVIVTGKQFYLYLY